MSKNTHTLRDAPSHILRAQVVSGDEWIRLELIKIGNNGDCTRKEIAITRVELDTLLALLREANPEPADGQ